MVKSVNNDSALCIIILVVICLFAYYEFGININSFNVGANKNRNRDRNRDRDRDRNRNHKGWSNNHSWYHHLPYYKDNHYSINYKNPNINQDYLDLKQKHDILKSHHDGTDGTGQHEHDNKGSAGNIGTGGKIHSISTI